MDVNDRANAGVVVQQPGGDDHVSAVILQDRHIGAADLAERPDVSWRRSVVLDLRLPGDPAKAMAIRMQKASERGPMRLAAHRTMAVVDELGLARKFKANAATQTGAMNHCLPPGRMFAA